MTRLKDIKAISFDVDGTLWDFNEVARRALAAVLEELERADPEAAEMLDVGTFQEIRDRVHEELRGKVTDLNVIRRQGFKQALSDVGRPNDELGSHLCDVYMWHRDAGRKPFPDVPPTFRELGQRFTLGLVSNGNCHAGALGLGDLVTFEVFAQDHGGIEKPDPRLFQIALETAGCTARELLHVGDSVENDVAGARKAGIRSVWVNRNGGQASGSARPDLEISTLRQLLRIL